MNELRCAMQEAHMGDLPAIKQYIVWLRFRRRINHYFYFDAHWIQSVHLGAPQQHWVGR